MSPSPEGESTFQILKEHLLDADSEWWPFAFLRPEPHQRFTSKRCAVLAILYGAPTALVAALLGRLAGDELETLHLWLFPVCVSAMLFATLRAGLASSWNRRAAELRPLYERRSAWQRRSRSD